MFLARKYCDSRIHTEFSEYYCSESDDGAIGGGENAGICQAGDPATLQGALSSSLCDGCADVPLL